VVPAANSRTAIETLCPLRAGNSVKAALETLKKFPSTVTFGGTIKSERMSGSPAVAIFMMANDEISSEKNLTAKVLKAMEEKLGIEKGKAVMGF